MPCPDHLRWQRVVLICLLPWLLQACAHRPAPLVLTEQAPNDWPQRYQQLKQLHSWQIRGKLGVRDSERSDSVVINDWTQYRKQYQISLSSALLGLGATRLQGTPDYLTIVRGGKEPFSAPDPTALIAQETGWFFPVPELVYWIKGVPSPVYPSSLVFTDEGDLAELEQAGWTLRYSRFSDQGRYRLPGKIVATRDQARIILVIKQWSALNDVAALDTP